jgi:hypothetical protein
MPVLTLTFNLPKEKGKADHAMRAMDYYCALFDIVTEARRRVKYDGGNRDIADFYDWLWRELNERGIDPLE